MVILERAQPQLRCWSDYAAAELNGLLLLPQLCFLLLLYTSQGVDAVSCCLDDDIALMLFYTSNHKEQDDDQNGAE